MPFPNLTEFAFSFSHAVVKINEKQFTGISGVKTNQPVQDAPVFGTGRAPIKRSAGQLQMGAGLLKFSDYEEATDFFKFLSPDPQFKTWNLDYTLVLETGRLRTIECKGCRLLDFDVDHQAGPEALGASAPFSFLSRRIDGQEVVLSPSALLQLGVGIAQNLLNLI